MGDDEGDKKRPRKIRLLDNDLKQPDFEKIVPKVRAEIKETPTDAANEERRITRHDHHLEFVPISPYEQAISKWLKTEYDIGIRVGKMATAGFVDKSKRIYVEPNQENSTLCHESTHAWLIIKKGFVTEDDRQVSTGEHARLCRIKGTEVNLDEKQKKILGEELVKPELYPETIYGVPYCSYVGALVDESSTLGKPEEEGHPMSNFHEFFASSMTTLTFDGYRFFGLLSELKALSERKDCPGIKKLYDKVMDMFSDVHRLGSEMFEEQSKYLWKLSRERSNLESNLKKLGTLLVEHNRGKDHEEAEKKKLPL